MLAEKLRSMGVVGAGGAGFPTYVKAQSTVEYVLANGAECEPLLHKDFEIMRHYPEEIVEGHRRMVEVTHAREGAFGIKEKNKEAVAAIKPHADRAGIRMVYLGDFYPSGDEYELVYTATGRLIPAGGIPLNVSCVVNNVETLYNVHLATQDQPVTRKFVSIAGAVKKPCSFWVPIGASFRDLIAMAGGSTVDDPAVFVSGLMMGTLAESVDEPVTKTTCGLILLPRDHQLVQRRIQPQESMNRIGKSACDQCSYCTEFCPRYLLGYDVQPHKVMRSLGFTLTGSDNWNQWGQLCCACGLCTLYACPEDLFPKEACDQAKVDLRAIGVKYEQPHPVRVHPMKEYRRVPLKMLRQRMKVDHYECETPFLGKEPAPASVRLLTKQHAGKAAVPAVKAGDKVKRGQTVARMEEKALGADVHASISGKVKAVSESWIEIEA
ncbi:MAG: SLBB domain-containing protein [Bryobacterales bacterium]|nr:SLBB domain-containing protein [Bryobacterales bacterium]